MDGQRDERDHKITRAHVSEIDHVVDQGALGGGERTLVLALDRDLFQFLPRGEEPTLIGGAAGKNEPAQAVTSLQERPKDERSFLQNATERSQSAEGEAAEERFRQDVEEEEMHWHRARHGHEIPQVAERGHEQTRGQQECEDIGEVRDEQDGDKQAFRLFQ